jgi:nitrogen regulatory protein P-II 1
VEVLAQAATLGHPTCTKPPEPRSLTCPHCRPHCATRVSGVGEAHLRADNPFRTVKPLKKIEAIIRPFKLDEVKSALDEVGVTGLTVIEAKGFGREKGHAEIYRGIKYFVDFLPKSKIEITVVDRLLPCVVEAIVQSARSGEIGDGMIFVSNIDEAIHIRSGEREAVRDLTERARDAGPIA